MAKRNSKKKWGATPMGFSPVQATASGSGYHEPSRQKKRRQERRNVKRQLKGGDYE
jgi:hypothetical protein